MTFEQRQTAVAKLKTLGWRKLLSVTSDGDKSNLKYGTLWIRGQQKFYLNAQTYNNLPV